MRIMPNTVVNRRRLKDRIIENISSSVKKIQELQYCSHGEVVLTNSDPHFQRLCEHLDHAFLHGLRHVTNGYWVMVQEFTHKATLKDIKQMQCISTNLGRGRAWLYQALSDQLLESYLRCFSSSSKLIRKHYVKEALVLDGQRLQILITLAAGLEYMNFQLEMNVPYLDLGCSMRTRTDSSNSDDVSICSMESGMSQSSSIVAGSYRDGIEIEQASEASASSISGSVSMTRENSEQLLGTLDEELNGDEDEQARIARISNLSISELDPSNHFDSDLEVIRVKAKHAAKAKSRRRKGITRASPELSADNNDNITNFLPVEASMCTATMVHSPTESASSATSGTESYQEANALSSSAKFEQAKINQMKCLEKTLVKTGKTVFSEKIVGFVEFVEKQQDTCSLVEKFTAVEESSRDISVTESQKDPKGLNCDDSKAGSTEGSGIVINVTEASTDQTDCTGKQGKERKNSLVECLNDPSQPHGIYTSCENCSPTQTVSRNVSSQDKTVSLVQLDHDYTAKHKEIFDSMTPDSRLSDDTSQDVPDHQKSSQIAEQSLEHDLNNSTGSLGIYSSPTDGAALQSSVSLLNTTLDSDLMDWHFVDNQEIVNSFESSIRSCNSQGDKDHPAEISVDNNMKLMLMLDIFHHEEEAFLKMYYTTIGHTEGLVQYIYVLLTNKAMYLLLPDSLEGKFLKETTIKYSEIDYISLSISYQIINIVCINRRKQFWITTGDEKLTRSLIGHIDSAIRITDLPRLSVLTDATTQKIAIRKWASTECKREAPDVKLLCYALLYIQDLSRVSVSKEPAVCLQGILQWRTIEESWLPTGASWLPVFGGGSWKPGYFVLKNGSLCLYTDRRHTNLPRLCIRLNEEDCTGCRRCPRSDRPHMFEVIQSSGSILQMAASSDGEMQDWLQALCRAVADHGVMSSQSSDLEPCCCVVTQDQILFCHEDVQSNFLRTLNSARLNEVSAVYTDSGQKEYCVMNFRKEASSKEQKLALYFASVSEREKLFKALISIGLQSKVYEGLLNDAILQMHCKSVIERLWALAGKQRHH